jgi:hypothetical protein
MNSRNDDITEAISRIVFLLGMVATVVIVAVNVTSTQSEAGPSLECPSTACLQPSQAIARSEGP